MSRCFMPPSAIPLRIHLQSKAHEVYLVTLPDGRVVARTVGELDQAHDEVRIAAGLQPRTEPTP